MPLPPPENLDNNVVALTRAMRTIESGNDYNKPGASKEYGAYQYIKPTWQRDAGKFLKNPDAPMTPENQNFVAYSRVKELKDQGYRPDQILSIWNSGGPDYEGKVGKNKYGVEYNVPRHVQRGMAEYQKEVQKLGGSFGPNVANASTRQEQVAPEVQEEPKQKSLGGFVSNLISSGGKLLGGIGHAVANPYETVSGIANIGAGALETGIMKGADALGVPHNNLPPTPEMEQFKGVVDFYKQRYGGIENVKDTLYEDPVGAVADASVLLGGAGAAIGKVGTVAEISGLARTGSAISKAGSLVDPLKVAGRGLGAIKSGASKTTTAMGDALTPLDDGLVNTLKPENVRPEMSLTERAVTKQKNLKDLNKYMEQAKRSVSNYSEDNALKLASQKAEDAVAQMDKQLKLYGKTKDMALERIASKPVDITGIKDSFAEKVSERTGAKFTQRGVVTTPRGQFSTITSATDRGLLTDTYSILKKLESNPTALRTDKAVDALQARLDYAGKNLYEPVNSQVEALVKDTVRDLNKRVQSMDENYRLANKGYSDTKGIREELNKALGLHANKGASLLKRVFSLTDGGTKALFDRIKQRTGIDLIREATLAKFAMESVGDYRQANLLEQLLNAGKVPTSPQGVINRVAEFAIDKAVERNPGNKAIRMLGGKPTEPAIGRIRRALKMTKQATPLGVASEVNNAP